MLELNFGWPIKRRVLKNFSPTRNKGIDIAGKKGQPVKATETGKVVYAGQGLIGFGKLLIIRHNDIYLSAYANNSQLLVSEGQHVEKGQVIAEVGDVGIKRTSLHFQIRKNGKPVNPIKFLPKK
jgi:lipoprotein NlpD